MVTDTCGQADGETAGQSNSKTRQRYRQGSYVAFGCMTATKLAQLRLRRRKNDKGRVSTVYLKGWADVDTSFLIKISSTLIAH